MSAGLTETASQDTIALDDAAPGRGLRTGEVLDHYRVLGQLGAGGMGEVYEALDLGLDRRVALKVIRQGSDDPEPRRRFLREARAMAKLSHPNVVAVHEVGSDAGVDFIAMELVDGTDLSRWRDRPRSWREVVAVYLEAGRGLAAAHARGMVHRDFKPSNVLVAADGRVLVTDFGLAKLAHDRLEPITPAQLVLDDEVAREQLRTITVHGVVVGTPAFMAPELLHGHPATTASDQYAFCAALYRTLTGQCPRGMSWDEVRAAVHARQALAWPVPTPPRWLRRVVERGLALHPAQRFESMDRVLRALEGGRRRTRWLVGAGGLALAGALAVGVLQPWSSPSAQASSREREQPHGEAPLPDDPEVARRVRALRLELAEIEAALDGRRLVEAMPRAAGAVAEARSLSFPPVLAEALTVAGEVQLFAHHFPQARASLQEAALVAEEARLDAVLARALLNLAEVLTRSSVDEEESTEVLRRAEAALGRIGDPPAALALLEVYRAFAADGAEGSIAQLEAAFAAYRQVPDHSRMRAVDVGLGLATLHENAGQHAEALRVRKWALAEGRELLGPHHPDVWFVGGLVADSLTRLGRYDEARHTLDTLGERWKDERGRQQLELYLGENVRPDAHTRTLAVRVLDPEGRPVPNAELVGATWLFANGKYLHGGTAEWRRLEQPARAWTDADGRATLEGLTDERAVMVAAEHDALGRSLPVDLPPGETPAEVVLSLRPWGGLRGTFEVEGLESWPLRTVMLAPREVAEPRRAQAEVVVQDRRYEFERLPAGRHNVYFVLEGRDHAVLTVRREVEVQPGATTELAWHDALPPRELEVGLDPGDGPWPAEAQLFLTVGEERIETSPELDRFLPAALERGPMQMVTIPGKGTARLLRLAAGPHTLCADLTWDPQYDPRRLFGLFRLERRMVCRPLAIDPNAAPQRFTLTLGAP